MDEIQKVLIKAGRKDLAQQYYLKTAEIHEPNSLCPECKKYTVEKDAAGRYGKCRECGWQGQTKSTASKKTADASSGKTFAAIDKLIVEYNDYWVFFDGLRDYLEQKMNDEKQHNSGSDNIEILRKLRDMMEEAKKLAMEIE